jgi:hypothetical protein
LRARHAEHYAQLAEAWATQFRRTDDLEWVRRLSAENENLVSAMNWALDSDNADVGLRVGSSANAALEMGFTVAIPVEPALALRGATEHRLYPVALVKAALEAAQRVDRRLAEERYAQALDAGRRLGDPTGGLLEACACFAHSLLEMTCGSFEAAADDNERAGELALAAGYLGFAAARFASAAAFRVGAVDDAAVVDLATRALALARQSGGSGAIIRALAALASALARTDPSRARALFAEYLETSDRVGAESAAERLQATIVAARLGDWPLTLRQARRAIPLLHWRAILPFLLGGFNVTALALADARPDAAARLQGAARSIGRTLAANQGPLGVPKAVAAPASTGFVNELRRQATRRLAGTLGEERLNQRRREGEDMALDDAVAYALTEIDGAVNDPSFSQA